MAEHPGWTDTPDSRRTRRPYSIEILPRLPRDRRRQTRSRLAKPASLSGRSDARTRDFTGFLRPERVREREALARPRHDYTLALTVRGVASSSDPQRKARAANRRGSLRKSTDTSLAETPGHCVRLGRSTALVQCALGAPAAAPGLPECVPQKPPLERAELAQNSHIP
ncbi:hypothetical protein DBV15_01539 [Temnothorax longispinosus]|uniref:Uncharacterized protein n=1 Tax=Temnothorax longispinosus TaxID=300112 RepID=A0A4S2KT66_9HYME|nr:hypothetical protein DBV15_01539 [Temnothorax longispinosus]